MNIEENVCPSCGQPYDAEGCCPEERAAWLVQGQGWAKEYLPEGWHQYHWEILQQGYGRFYTQGRVLDLYTTACIGQHPDGWYGVVVCDTDDRSETDIFNFYPPNEQPQTGPFATKAVASEAILRRLTLLEDQLEPIPIAMPLNSDSNSG